MIEGEGDNRWRLDMIKSKSQESLLRLGVILVIEDEKVDGPVFH